MEGGFENFTVDFFALRMGKESLIFPGIKEDVGRRGSRGTGIQTWKQNPPGHKQRK